MFSFKNQAEILAKLEARKAALEGKLDKAANQGLILGLNEVKGNLYPGHGFLTGNLQGSYDRCSEVTKPGDGKRLLTWTSDVEYQPVQELVHAPHLRPGIHAAWPAIKDRFQETMKE